MVRPPPGPPPTFFFLPPPNGLIGPVVALILLRFPLSSAAESVGEAQMEVMGAGAPLLIQHSDGALA